MPELLKTNSFRGGPPGGPQPSAFAFASAALRTPEPITVVTVVKMAKLGKVVVHSRARLTPPLGRPSLGSPFTLSSTFAFGTLSDTASRRFQLLILTHSLRPGAGELTRNQRKHS